MKPLLATVLFLILGSPVVAQKLRHRKLIQLSDPSAKIEGQYIVVLKENADDVASRAASFQTAALRTVGSNASVKSTYKNTMKGFLVEDLSDSELRELLDREDVDYVEENRKITVHSIQNDAPWNLDRLDQRRKRDLDGKYNNGGFTGSGVTVFILDNGMSPSHEDFEGRVTDCISFADGNEGCSDGSGEDAHGTHVGGIVGGKKYGVAKGVNLVNVKVLSRDGGSTASSIDGLEYVAEQKRLNPDTPMVANLSYGGVRSRAENAAVDAAVDAGVVVVVAAGNAFIPACWSSPASAKKSIAVAATNRRDWKPLFSNWGRCVSIFAPGVRILSALPDSDTASGTFDGTSQAAPHVAGAAALYLERDPTMTPGQVLKALENDAKRCVLFRGFLSPKIMLNLEALV